MSNLLRIAAMLGWQDVRQSYRRSAFGPFWLTIGMAAQIATIGLVFGLIFRAELDEYLPFLATSIIFWGLISTSINEGCVTFISAEAMIKQIRASHFLYVVRTVWRNYVIAGHNLVILPVVFIFFWKFSGWTLLGLLPGLVILTLNITWLVWLLAIASARFRDIPPIISSLMTITFYLTPVMWYPNLLGNNVLAHLLLGLNPVYHWLQIVRLPILGDWPTWENWGIGMLSAGIGWSITLAVNKKYKNMIAYWV